MLRRYTILTQVSSQTVDLRFSVSIDTYKKEIWYIVFPQSIILWHTSNWHKYFSFQ